MLDPSRTVRAYMRRLLWQQLDSRGATLVMSAVRDAIETKALVCKVSGWLFQRFEGQES